MSPPMNQVTDSELQAFVDGQLDSQGRIEVLDHLLRDRDACARTLQDLRAVELMRTLAGRRVAASETVTALARRLEQRAKLPERRWRFALAAGVVGLSLTLGLGAPIANARPPEYLQEALESHQAATVRQHMASHSERTAFDPGDIRTATRIQVPTLPAGWRITDVQVVPSDFGPAVQLSMETDAGQPLSLFATYGRAGAPDRPRAVRIDRAELVSWQNAGNTYVLIGGGGREALLRAADDLADNRLA